MCGRYGLHHSGAEIAARFSVPALELEAFEARYNVAPTETMPVVTAPDGERRLAWMRWGLPLRAGGAGSARLLFNARAETVAEKPTFREAVRRRRCLVPASGFYEWRTTPAGKQPVYIRRRDGRPFAFAGLWEVRDGPDGPLPRYAILTTAPNELMAPIHSRMPVILPEAAEATWLDLHAPVELVCGLLLPCPSDPLEAFPVSPAVNRAGFDGPECLRPATPSLPLE